MFVDRSRNPEGDIVLAALRFGNLLILIQPPRGFGENPIAIYHDPDLPPSTTTWPPTAGSRPVPTTAASAPTR